MKGDKGRRGGGEGVREGGREGGREGKEMRKCSIMTHTQYKINVPGVYKPLTLEMV